MTPALRKAAVLSLVLVALTIIGAVLLLNEPDRDYGTEPGGPEETSRPEEQAEKPIRKEAVISTSPGTETANKPGDAKEPAPKTEKSTADSEPGGLLVLQFLEADGEEPLGNEQFTLLLGGIVFGAGKTRNLTLRTDSEGFARVTKVPEGEYPALLRHPRYLADRRILTISSAESGAEVNVVEVLFMMNVVYAMAPIMLIPVVMEAVLKWIVPVSVMEMQFISSTMGIATKMVLDLRELESFALLVILMKQ